MRLQDYLRDGADNPPRAVLHVFNAINSDFPEIEVGRWENCREQGYVISAKGLNIAFFEHRNSDEIHAVKFNGYFINTPSIHDISENHAYCNSKHATDFHVGAREFLEMAEWIHCQFIIHLKDYS